MNSLKDHGWSAFLKRHNLTEEIIRKLMEQQSPPIEHPDISAAFKVGKSEISGLGMIAVRSVRLGEVFPAGRIGGVRFQLARFVNHSDTPNSVVHYDAHLDSWITTLTDISPGEEMTLDYSDNIAKYNRTVSQRWVIT